MLSDVSRFEKSFFTNTTLPHFTDHLKKCDFMYIICVLYTNVGRHFFFFSPNIHRALLLHHSITTVQTLPPNDISNAI